MSYTLESIDVGLERGNVQAYASQGYYMHRDSDLMDGSWMVRRGIDTVLMSGSSWCEAKDEFWRNTGNDLGNQWGDCNKPTAAPMPPVIVGTPSQPDSVPNVPATQAEPIQTQVKQELPTTKQPATNAVTSQPKERNMSITKDDIELVKIQQAEGYGGMAKAIAIFGVTGLIFSGGAALAGAAELIMLPIQLIGDVAGAIGEVVGGVAHGVSGAIEGGSGMFGAIPVLLTAGVALLAAKRVFEYVTAYRHTQALQALDIDSKRLVLLKQQLDLRLILPDAKGNLPIARGLLESGAVTADIFQLLQDRILNDRPVALPQPVPTDVHYQVSNDKTLNLSNGMGAFTPLIERGSNEFSIRLSESEV